ncbi:hypothetical protein KRR38_25630 [Novosphingobium sp. G106]|uniref:hypothetical protein n=1 Tax=Novosphingobium sp. G106 TaxID=2849500 RepID=UPI001C2DDDA3|nr:hypothetical protein [Novosphingobium sp. G106]MBV1690966.1 hypothetical protein [Novosphingobium sp. G106]
MAIAIASAGLLPPTLAKAAPDLAACPPVKQAEGWERERARPLAVPEALRAVLRSDLLHYAVATLGGGTVCLDTSFMETTDKLALSDDKRFLSFGWLGYESYGHIVVDRTGKGAMIETGVAPHFSPSRRYFAAADQTESEFGSLSGLAVWRVDATGTTEIGRIDELPRMNDWRIDGWSGESCVDLSAVPFEQSAKAPRVRFRAGPGKDGWQVARSAKGCAGQ